MRAIQVLLALPFLFSVATAAEITATEYHTATKPSAADNSMSHQGQVINVIDTGNYTYMQVSADNKKVWLAVLTMAVKKGDMVRYGEGPVVTNFFSKSLDRKFDKVIFISRAAIEK